MDGNVVMDRVSRNKNRGMGFFAVISKDEIGILILTVGVVWPWLFYSGPSSAMNVCSSLARPLQAADLVRAINGIGMKTAGITEVP